MGSFYPGAAPDKSDGEALDADLAAAIRRCQRPLTAEILFARRHGFAHFVDGRWLCCCGCGRTWTRAAWRGDR